jgi:formylglycine-generating enzyme required for sulfatase activity
MPWRTMLLLQAMTPLVLPTAATMVNIPAGVFVRGDDAGDPDEKPVQRVTVTAFAIDLTEVTVEHYAACVKAKACRALAHKEDTANRTLPVTGVSWQEATAYCHWAGKRLPSEAEWEKAARGTDGRRYPWGNEFSCQRGNFGNFSMDGRCAEEGAPGKPVAVGSYPSGASPYGVLDMAGNVWEWTQDTYQHDAYRRAEAGVVRGTVSESCGSCEAEAAVRFSGCHEPRIGWPCLSITEMGTLAFAAPKTARRNQIHRSVQK